jgi:polyhydroxyalkanoate synthase
VDTATSPPSEAELTDAIAEIFTSLLPVDIDAESASEFTKTTARQPFAFANRALRMAAEQIRITAGLSDVGPERRDRRFADEAFTTNPVYKRMAQSYLLWAREFHGMIDDLDLDVETRMRVDFFVNMLTEAAAPTNQLLGNPAALRKAIETNGKSLMQGMRNAAADFAHNEGMPLMVDSTPFAPGETTAVTPGAVVFRNPILELIQYEPTTPKVHKIPLMISPPQINKFYILDLAPGRSLVEHAVGQGHQVFMISWRNPGPEQRDWDLDAYVNAVIEASDAVLEITGAKKLNMLGVCAGGITNAAVLGHLAAIEDARVNSASFLVSVLDWAAPSTLGSLLTGPAVETMRDASAQSGILRGKDLGKIFALMRPNDLVWNYWVNNYLMGDKPAPFDVLAWNCDATNLPAGLHSDFLDMASANALTKKGAVEVLDTPIDLAQVDCPSFVVGAVNDHITPWQGCYDTVNLLGGESEFVLSSQGHIQALVNPSGNPKGSYRLNPATPGSADEWLDDATEHSGSWWDYWVTWLEPKGGKLINPPAELGSEANPIITAAPGEYVVAPLPDID